MSTSWQSCLTHLKRQHPEWTPAQCNEALQTIWYNPAAKQEWLLHHKYTTLQTLQQDPDLQNYQPSDFNPKVKPSKTGIPKGSKKTVVKKKKAPVQEADSSSEEDEEVVVAPKKSKKTEKDYQAEYYRLKSQMKKGK